MPFPRCHGGQPLQNLALLVRYLAIIPHFIVTTRHVTDVSAYGNGRVLVCCRTHIACISLLVASSGSDEGSAFIESEGVMRDRWEFFRGCLSNGEGRQKVKSFKHKASTYTLRGSSLRNKVIFFLGALPPKKSTAQF